MIFKDLNKKPEAEVVLPLREGSGGEELNVLPRHTKVIVTGNKRTKSVLVGLQGVVKKVVGLGGWHWLVLNNGVEIKLQRNALRVLEHPTGNEDDRDFDSFGSNSDIDDKELEPICNSEFQKINKPRVQNIESSSTSAKASRESYTQVQSIHTYEPKVNLGKLGSDSLDRYIRHYFNLASNISNISRKHNVTSRPNCP